MKTSWLAVVAVLFAGSPVAAQNAPDTPKPSGFEWRDYPSLRAGIFRLDVHAKVQSDVRRADEDLDRAGGTYETATKRIGVSGRITNRVTFEVERELREENPWRDAYVNVQFADAFELRGGKFKMPFSYDELTGIVKIDFAYRAMVARTIAPARDIGVMAHGRFFRRIVNYQLGVFQHDGENARMKEAIFLLPGEEPPNSERSIAGRLVVEPLRHSSGPRDLRRLSLGVAMTASDVPEGLNSLRGRSLFGSEFAERMYVSGARRRIGTEAIWLPGPFSVKWEYARSNEERKRQGLLDDDISDFVTSGWYLSGTWAITGEQKDGDIEPRTPLFRGGFGAVELAARYERLSFASALKQGTPFLNPRADPLLGNAESILTLGANWYLNKWGKVVVNGIREAFEDPERTAVPGRTSGWAAVMRLQFVM
jgi:phosphate-selective porin OprO and OprP